MNVILLINRTLTSFGHSNKNVNKSVIVFFVELKFSIVILQLKGLQENKKISNEIKRM